MPWRPREERPEFPSIDTIWECEQIAAAVLLQAVQDLDNEDPRIRAKAADFILSEKSLLRFYLRILDREYLRRHLVNMAEKGSAKPLPR